MRTESSGVFGNLTGQAPIVSRGTQLRVTPGSSGLKRLPSRPTCRSLAQKQS